MALSTAVSNLTIHGRSSNGTAAEKNLHASSVRLSDSVSPSS